MVQPTADRTANPAIKRAILIENLFRIDLRESHLNGPAVKTFI